MYNDGVVVVYDEVDGDKGKIVTSGIDVVKEYLNKYYQRVFNKKGIMLTRRKKYFPDKHTEVKKKRYGLSLYDSHGDENSHDVAGTVRGDLEVVISPA